jgi:hypothetical protein
MEFQQKDNKLLSLAGRYFMKTDGEANCNGRKNTMVELTFMVKAFTQNVGSYWVLMNFLLQKKCCFHFLIRTDQNSIYGDMPYLEATHWLWAIDLG